MIEPSFVSLAPNHHSNSGHNLDPATSPLLTQTHTNSGMPLRMLPSVHPIGTTLCVQRDDRGSRWELLNGITSLSRIMAKVLIALVVHQTLKSKTSQASYVETVARGCPRSVSIPPPLDQICEVHPSTTNLSLYRCDYHGFWFPRWNMDEVAHCVNGCWGGSPDAIVCAGDRLSNHR